jgi:hypothetical protein
MVPRECLLVLNSPVQTNILAGTAFREIKGKLFPSVGMKKTGEHIRVNFGQSPFVFDIDGMMAVSNILSIF